MSLWATPPPGVKWKMWEPRRNGGSPSCPFMGQGDHAVNQGGVDFKNEKCLVTRSGDVSPQAHRSCFVISTPVKKIHTTPRCGSPAKIPIRII